MRIIGVGVMALCLVGCPKSGPGPDDSNLNAVIQRTVNAGVELGAQFGCSYIKPQDQVGALAVLSQVEMVANISIVDAWAMFVQLAQQPPLAFIWYSLHSVLDPLGKVIESQWTTYAQGALASGVRGCQAGIGANRT